MVSKILATASVGVALLLSTPAVSGDDTSEIDRDAARVAVQQGDEHKAAKRYQAALKAYQRADDIMGVPTTAIEVGQVQLLLGHLVEAHAAFKRAANHPKKAGEPAPFTAARKEAGSMAEDIFGRIPTVRIEVNGAPSDDVTVTINDEIVEAWASTQLLNPGAYEIVAQARGYHPANESMVIIEGESRDIVLELVQLAEDGVPEPPEEPQDTGPPSPWPIVYVGFGVAAAGIIAGSITGTISLSKAGDVKENCIGNQCPSDQEDDLEDSRTFAHVSTTSFVIAGVGAAVGGIGLWMALSGDAEDDADKDASADDADDDDSADDDTDAQLLVGPGHFAVRVRF